MRNSEQRRRTTKATKRGEPALDPNDSQRFIKLYEDMIVRGDRDAIWRFHVFENNLMEEDPEDLLDPFTVPPDDDEDFKMALSVSFFECRLFYRGTFRNGKLL